MTPITSDSVISHKYNDKQIEQQLQVQKKKNVKKMCPLQVVHVQ